MKKLTTIKLVALLLVLVMILSTVSCFDDDTPTTTKPSTSTTTTTGKPDGPDDPPAHVCVFGEWEVIEAATTTTDGLCERKCDCGAVEQRVIPASAKEYTITYIDAPQHSNPTTYTVNDCIYLQKAVWSGLSFAYWTDKEGNIIDEIPYGTEGNITLYANWRLIENVTVSSGSNPLEFTIYSEEENRYYFGFKLGTINNVVLDELSSYKYSGGTSHTWSISETVSFTETDAQSIANTVSKSVTSSQNWSSATADATHNSTSTSTTTGASISANINAGSTGFIKASISGEIHNDKTDGEESGSSITTTNSSGGSSGSSSGTSNTVSSTISFVTDTSTQITRSETLNPSSTPAGMYRYVQAGDIEVYVIVTYDIEEKDYFINIFSNIYRVFDMMLYGPAFEYNGNIRIVDSEPFSFDIDIDSLAEDVIANAYYVEFDANGGNGSMPTQMMLPNTEINLCENKFINTGYAFAGWRVKNGDKTVVYTDGQKVENLGSPGERVTLEAIWTSTEPVWVEKESGSFLFADFPSGFDTNNSIYKSMEKEAYTEFETETTKRVVTIEKVGYVYWHWMHDTSAGAGDRIIYYKKGTYSLNGYGYYDFGAFLSSEDYRRTTSNRNQPTPDYYWYTDTGRTSNADSQGSKYWYRFEYYRCTYTDYVKGSVE
ncbi:MAG: InlB B-repeat-containing protein [Clostridia bacterium]|nr:InlB B-repeat-containing protein [Clostridia bacterium]